MTNYILRVRKGGVPGADLVAIAGSLSWSGFAAILLHGSGLAAGLASLGLTGLAATLSRTTNPGFTADMRALASTWPDVVLTWSGESPPIVALMGG